MRLIVHIGYNKTGTSSIQSYCLRNAEALRRDGLCYPKIGTHGNGGHHAVSKLLTGMPSNKVVNTPIDLLNRIREEFEESACETLLLSSEHLVLANSQNIKAVRDAFRKEFGMDECKIVVYLRRHDLWFESLFNQAVKNIDSPPWSLDIKDYIIQLLGSKGNMPQYHMVLERWAKEFGLESIIVRPFEFSQFKNGNLLNDFFENAFPQHEVKEDAVSMRANLSVPPENLYMIGLLRRWPKSPERDAAIGRILRAPSATGTASSENFCTLTANQRKSIVEFFTPEYTNIARRFMNRTDGRLFLEEVKKT